MLTLILLAGLLQPLEVPRDFERQRTVAEQNLATTQGAEFNTRLRAFLEADSALAGRVQACRDSLPLPHSATGYLEFGPYGGHELIVSPDTEFNACLAKAYQGLAPPEPPRRPFVNVFDLR